MQVMDRSAATNPATAREIILEIVRNMREGLEPLHYSTLAPALYHVYLHPEDMDRLRGIVPRIVEEAARALDAELDALNRASLAERLKLARRGEPKIERPEGGWRITILENTDDAVEPGDIAIYSELAMPAKADLGGGALTKRIATRRLSGAQAAAQTSYDKPSAVAPTEVSVVVPAPAAPPESDASVAPPEPGAFAVIEYEDAGGRKTFQMIREQIVVGRGGRDYWTDLKLETLPDVSREHFRLRRDPATGQFFLKDLSRLGTTINGEKAPSSIEYVDGEKRDRNVEAPVPPKARIGLANVLFLEFRSAAEGLKGTAPEASA
jgi:FHA domain